MFSLTKSLYKYRKKNQFLIISQGGIKTYDLGKIEKKKLNNN